MFKPTHSTYTVQYMQNYKYFTHMDKGEDMGKASGKCLYCHNSQPWGEPWYCKPMYHVRVYAYNELYQRCQLVNLTQQNTTLHSQFILHLLNLINGYCHLLNLINGYCFILKENLSKSPSPTVLTLFYLQYILHVSKQCFIWLTHQLHLINNISFV